MPVMGWVTISVFVFGTMWSVGVWLVRRRLDRMDKLEDAIHGREGLVRQVDRLVTRDEFNESQDELEKILRGISDEGQEREKRIREHVEQGRRSSEQDLREMRAELSQIHKRIDAAFRARR